MAHIWGDRVAETTTTTGTGALALTAITGFQRFRNAKRSDGTAIQVGDTLDYALEGVDASNVPTGEYEYGVGTYSALDTLTRTTVLGSSNAGSVVTLSAGTKNVFLDDIASTRNTLQQYSGTSEPSAPVEGLINFAKDFNGWAIPYAKASSNRSSAIFPLLTGRPGTGVAVSAGAGAALTAVGLAITTAGSTITASVANTSAYTTFARAAITTTSTASTGSSMRLGSDNIFLRGTSANNGARLILRFGLETVGNTNVRAFCGLLNSAAAQAATFDPATAINCIGIGKAATDTNWKLYYNDGVGTPTIIDLGANYPVTAQGAMVELVLWAEASASAVKYLVRRLDDLTIAPTTGSLSTDIPTAGTQMNAHLLINNNATAASSVLAVHGIFQETGI